MRKPAPYARAPTRVVFNCRATSTSTRCSPKHAMVGMPARRSAFSPAACPAGGPSSCGAETSAIRFASIGLQEGLRLFRSTPRPSSHSRGFTLVESLVALTVMMILLSAIGGLSASSLRLGRYVERHLADIENAQQILAGLPSRNELANGALTGEMAGYRWRLDSEPFS